MNSRYYNSEVGRFINSDGLIAADGDVLSSNTYIYCQNNPIMFIDPSGYLRIPSFIVAVAVDIAVSFLAPQAFTYLAPLKAWNRWWGKWIAQRAFNGLKYVAKIVMRFLYGTALTITANVTMVKILGGVNFFSIGGIISVIADLVTDKKIDGYITV